MMTSFTAYEVPPPPSWEFKVIEVVDEVQLEFGPVPLDARIQGRDDAEHRHSVAISTPYFCT